MSFLQPGLLWLFTLLIPLAAIYLLKVRPVRKQTTALFLWEEIFLEKKASALFRRLRDLLSLLLMMLAVAAVVLAMSQPVLRSGQDNKDIILLIDNSVSMSARQGNKTRLERGCGVARDILKAMNINRQAVLASVSHDIRYMVNLTNNQRALIDGLGQVEESDFAFRKETLESLNINQDLLRQYRVILISDGCFEGNDELGEIELLKISEPLENMGISGFDLRRLPGRPARLGLYFEIASSFKEAKEVDVLLCAQSLDNIVKVCPATVQPGVNEAEIYMVDEPAVGKWYLKLDLQKKDSLDKDNTAYAVVEEHRPIRVAVKAAKGGFFLARCVQAFAENAELMVLVEDDPDLVLSCGANVAEEDSALQIVFKPSGKSVFWDSLGGEDEPGIVKVEIKDHPSIRYCPVEDVVFAGLRRIKAPKNSLVIAESQDNVPLIYKASREGQSAYVVNMDPEEGEFFLSAYFPVMVYSMARDLTGREIESRCSSRPGTHVTTAEGQSVQLGELGFHELDTGSEKRIVACSLPGEHESLLDNTAAKDTSKAISRRYPPNVLLIVLAVMLAALECMLYHRRKVG